MPRIAGTAILFAVLLAGCSHSRNVDSEELKSAATELTSISAEAELFANFVAEGRATAAYTKGHPEHLREQLKDLRKEINKNTAPPLSALQQLSQQLDQALNAMPVDLHDPRWPELAARFARIARTARDLSRSL